VNYKMIEVQKANNAKAASLSIAIATAITPTFRPSNSTRSIRSILGYPGRARRRRWTRPSPLP
jgi:hypothetical protein